MSPIESCSGDSETVLRYASRNVASGAPPDAEPVSRLNGPDGIRLEFFRYSDGDQRARVVIESNGHLFRSPASFVLTTGTVYCVSGRDIWDPLLLIVRPQHQQWLFEMAPVIHGWEAS